MNKLTFAMVLFFGICLAIACYKIEKLENRRDYTIYIQPGVESIEMMGFLDLNADGISNEPGETWKPIIKVRVLDVYGEKPTGIFIDLTKEEEPSNE